LSVLWQKKIVAPRWTRYVASALHDVATMLRP
jgi:hypothetical protein